MSNENREPWLSLAEICEYLSVSNDTLYRLIKNKAFPAQKVGNRWKAKKTQIDIWIEQNNHPNVQAPLHDTDVLA
jgi:excisionase family DNA binding protein